jgi:hypothetical protein
MAMAALALPVLLTGAAPAWTATKAPLPADAAASDPLAGIWDVSCLSATTCAAAGYYTDVAGDRQVLLLTGHGSRRTAARAPLPAGAAGGSGARSPGPTVAAVACLSGSACLAVGDYTDSSGHLQGLLLSGFGSAWTATRAPLPGDAATNPDAVLSGVACPSATGCVVTGYYTGGGSPEHQHGLLLAGHGSSWTAIRAPLPAAAPRAAGPDAAVGPIAAAPIAAAPIAAAGGSGNAGLWDVACPSSTVCVAAGFYNRHGLLLAGHGSSWTAIQAPLPAHAAANSQADLDHVTCPSTATCVAAGDYDIKAHSADGLLVTGHGSSWTATEVPLPAAAGGRSDPGITGVSCGSATACAAAGYYTDSAGQEQGLLLTGHGSSWTATRAPRPRGARPGAYLNGVSCPAAAVCAAVGYYTDSSGHGQGLLLERRGSSWTARTAPLPAGAATDPSAYLNGLACTSIAACLAAGAYTDSSGHGQGLLPPGPGGLSSSEDPGWVAEAPGG